MRKASETSEATTGADRTQAKPAINPATGPIMGFELRDSKIADVRLVLGVGAPTPRRVREAEAVLEGREPTEDLASAAIDVALAGAAPLQHNAFKLDLVHALITRGVTRLAG